MYIYFWFMYHNVFHQQLFNDICNGVPEGNLLFSQGHYSFRDDRNDILSSTDNFIMYKLGLLQHFLPVEQTSGKCATRLKGSTKSAKISARSQLWKMMRPFRRDYNSLFSFSGNHSKRSLPLTLRDIWLQYVVNDRITWWYFEENQM